MKNIILSILAIFLLSGCHHEYVEPTPENGIALLQGTWISTDDKESQIQLQDEVKVDMYMGETMNQDVYVLELKEDGLYLMVNGDEDNFEYKINKITEKELSLTYLARGNELKYER